MTDHLTAPVKQSADILAFAGGSRITHTEGHREDEMNRRIHADYQDAINSARQTVQSVDESVTHIREGLHNFRNLLNQYQRTRNQWEHQSQVVQRASEGWIPNIKEDIDRSQRMAEDVLSKLPHLESRLGIQLEEYHEGKQRAAHIQAQLEWHADSWMNKLRKILMGEVKEKRVKLLRVTAPFLLGALILSIVGMVGRLLLQWNFLYYRNIQRNIKP